MSHDQNNNEFAGLDEIFEQAQTQAMRAAMRDQFAALAMQGLIANLAFPISDAEIARRSYGMADAMLAHREKPQ